MLTHKGTQTIETARLILRRFTMEDAQSMYDNWASNPEVTKFLTWPPHTSMDITKAVLRDWIAQYEHEQFYQWAIVPKELGQPIGSMSVIQHNPLVQKAHMGYCIGSAWWHQGYTSEALRAAVGFLFEEVGFLRIEARHDVNNPNSGGVMRKCGMTYEGTHRQSDWCNQGICDTSWYAVLKSEWQEASL